jgi:antitoxin component YwqK of YwqJK toxin-antitoxin module
MKKLIFMAALLLITLFAEAQSITFDQPSYSKDGVRLELLNTDDQGPLIKYVKLNIKGQVEQEGFYLNGKPHGIWKMYYSNGSFTTMKFSNGKRIVLQTIIDGRRTEVYYAENRPIKSITYFD